jgi:tripartite-type tricarboxylate transporter receptor subunit TctC
MGLAPTLWAQARTLSIVVTQVPSGASDFMSRALGEHLGPALNVPAIVLNKPGAAGEIAATLVSGSTPDSNDLARGIQQRHGDEPASSQDAPRPGQGLSHLAGLSLQTPSRWPIRRADLPS